MDLNFSTNIKSVNPNIIPDIEFEIKNQDLITKYQDNSDFNINQNKIEIFVYDYNLNLIHLNYNFKDYIPEVVLPDGTLHSVSLNPDEYLNKIGLIQGNFILLYNFIKYELGSNPFKKYYIKEISPDRTELRISSNDINEDDILNLYQEFKNTLDEEDTFDEFYISFGENKVYIGVNILYENNSILIKLYNPLPNEFEVLNEIYVFTKKGETEAFKINLVPKLTQYIDPNITNLRGPNFNLDLGDFVNNSTKLKSEEDLIDSLNKTSENNLKNILSKKGVQITPDYTNFEDFIHFSSAKSRILNFILKVEEIKLYQDEIDSYEAEDTTNSEKSIEILEDKITEIIKNFDGYEYYLYYNNNSDYSYPKEENSSFPYSLLDPESEEVKIWLGSDEEDNDYYGGIILEASNFDKNNQNWLYYTIPDYIKENPENINYMDFCNMVGQHFDEIWLYTKAVSQRLNTVNTLDEGIPLKLAEEAVKSLGFPSFGSNFSNQELYLSLIGEKDGIYTPPTGSENITNFIAINNGDIVNNWEDYSPEYTPTSFPYSIDKISKEVFKRLYHNMIYLVKKKGTISGLRQLINIWGIPNTILRINEFGGQNKTNENDFDYWYERYSYAYNPSGYNNEIGSVIRVPWLNLTNSESPPESIFLRFKPSGLPTSSVSQSIWSKSNDGSSIDFGVDLYFNENESQGYETYGTLVVNTSGSTSGSIYLPFFNGDWWSLMLRKNTSDYTLYAKNKYNIGSDGNYIGHEASSSITTIDGWETTTEDYGIYIGGIEDNTEKFKGYYQEFRYYSYPISEDIFNDYVANPESISGEYITGSLSSYNLLNFRAPLGNELESFFQAPNSGSVTEDLESLHPAVEEIPSFTNGSSSYEVQYFDVGNIFTYSIPNTETYLINQPVLGTRTRISNKIQVFNSQSNFNSNLLHRTLTIQPDRIINNSFTNNSTNLEVAFSPQDEINDDISQTFGYNLLTNYLADPREIIVENNQYPLKEIAKEYFQKYTRGDLYDYIRLIKFFDNSLFKAIKNFVPSRTQVSTGLLIKPHYLERNRFTPVSTDSITQIAKDSLGEPILLQNLEISDTITLDEDLLISGSYHLLEEELDIEITIEEDNSWGSLLVDEAYFRGEIEGAEISIYSSPRNPFLDLDYKEYESFSSSNTSGSFTIDDDITTIDGVTYTIPELPADTWVKFKFKFSITDITYNDNYSLANFGIYNSSTGQFIHNPSDIISLNPQNNILLELRVNTSQLTLGSEWKPAFKGKKSNYAQTTLISQTQGGTSTE